MITSYNLVVAVAALALVPFARRLRPRPTGIVGVALFTGGSAGCAAAWSLDALIAFRCVQGLGGALLLAASLRALAAFWGRPLAVPPCGRRPGQSARRPGRPWEEC